MAGVEISWSQASRQMVRGGYTTVTAKNRSGCSECEAVVESFFYTKYRTLDLGDSRDTLVSPW
jgi:hypothetical protein